METIITGCITGAITLLVCLINNSYQNRANERKHNETITLIDYKLSELTKRVDKHNNVIERVYKLEQTSSLHEEKIKVVNHRLEDLEKEE